MLNLDVTCSEIPLIDTAWSTLDAANDLKDWQTTCRRVIDASLRGGAPARPDLKIVFGFFD